MNRFESALVASLLAVTGGSCGSTPAGPDAQAAPDAAESADAQAETAVPDGGDAADGSWRPLSADPTLPDWDRYLGKPSAAEPPLGLDADPRGVFSVVTLDGEPAIRVSGEVWGALISKQDYCGFHLRLQYRWGTAVWPPLNSIDSGIMYLSTGPLGAVNAGGPTLSSPIGSGAFLVSIECQLTLAAAGEMDALGPIDFLRPDPVLSQDSAPSTWKQVDIVVHDDTAQHFVDGRLVSTGSGFEVTWPGQVPAPLRCGKLQLQSEGAEIFFRRVEIQPLP